MSVSNLFVLGLLLLTANLSFCALFAPGRGGEGVADGLLRLWKWLFLAAMEVAAWAFVLHQGGAAQTYLETFTKCAASFVFLGGEGGGFSEPWRALAPFITLNGLLFIPAALVPWVIAGRAVQTARTLPQDIHRGEALREEEALRADVQRALAPAPGGASASAASIFDAPTIPESGVQPEKAHLSGPHEAEPAPPSPSPLLSSPPPLPRRPAPSISGEPNVQSVATTPVLAAAGTAIKPFGFRGTIPKVRSRAEALSPEEELAEQMKPVGPTPPPIRFQWTRSEE